MPSIGFTVFKEKLLDHSKKQTIRKLRKRPIKVGDKLHLFWHLRQKDCEKLFETICTETFYITISYRPEYPTTGSEVIRVDLHSVPKVWEGDMRNLTDWEADDLARKDGFKDRFEMGRMFFRMHEKSADGQTIFQVIRWS